jgi:hypothetical protein
VCDLRGRLTGGPLPHEALRLPHRLGAPGQERLDDGRHGFGRIGGDFVHEPDLQSDVRAEPLTRKKPASSSAGRDLREDERGDDRRHNP